MSVADVLRLANTGGVIAILVLILYGGMKGQSWWVFGHFYRELQDDRDRWRDIALRNSNLAETVAGLPASPRQ